MFHFVYQLVTTFARLLFDAEQVENTWQRSAASGNQVDERLKERVVFAEEIQTVVSVCFIVEESS